MTQLYALADQYRAFNEFVEAALDQEDLTEDDLQMFIDTLDGIQDALENKVENIAKFMKNIEGDIKAYKEEEKRLAQKRKYLENKFDGLKSYTQSVLEVNGIDKIKAGKFTARLQKNNPSVGVVDETKIPEAYRIPQPDKIDNKSILEDLKAGKEIEGVQLITDKMHLRIS
ncbi:siphovirus Gp157 family protein [Paenibacillus cremeus]|nr:siphovirus Gp157 family protein [Paenibacillus cremeus]